MQELHKLGSILGWERKVNIVFATLIAFASTG